jgi:hypothetical protein
MFVPELIETGVTGADGITIIVMFAPDPILDGLDIV